MTIYDHRDYRRFLSRYIEAQTNGGHGLMSRWAEALRVSPTLLSQILKGKKNLSLEHADGLASEMRLDAKETDYFFLLVENARAGTQSLRQRFEKKIEEAQRASRLFKNRVQDAHEIPADQKARYYSSWLYAGVRNLAVCQGISSLEQIAERLGLPRERVSETIAFLEQAALLSPRKKGWASGVANTYLPNESPYIARHHQSWRLKAAQNVDAAREEDLFYTSPMSLSLSVATEIRKDLVDAIARAQEKAGPTPSETVRCLNIDFFEY